MEAVSAFRGGELDVSTGVSRIGRDPGSAPFVVATARDAAPCRRAQASQRRTERATLEALAIALASAIDVGEVTTVVAAAALNVMGASGSLVARMVDGGREIEILDETGTTYDCLAGRKGAVRGAAFPGDAGALRHRFSIDAHRPLCVAARSRRVVWRELASGRQAIAAELCPVFETGRRDQSVSLPLMSRGELIGLLGLRFAGKRRFDDRDKDFLTSFGDQCALAFARAQLYELTIEARDAAERSTIMRDELLSIVGHDLGNPLAAVRLLAKSIADATLGNETVAQAVAAINAAASTMNGLLSDLSDLAAIDSGGVNVQRRYWDVGTITSDAVGRATPLCGNRGLTIDSIAPSLLVPCDAKRVHQVLGNLLGNAIKFTPRGGRIAIKAVRSGGDVRFSVADSGPGIPDDAREHVFARYWRGKERDLTKGVGLGLFISKGIVQAHGGSIWCESQAGRGTTFFFTLPIAPA